MEYKHLKLLILFFLVVFSSAFSIASSNQKINIYDKYGHKTGYYEQKGDITIEYDKYGHKVGSLKKGSNGMTIKYDKYGHKIGSFKTIK